jgi:hypothetical protein
MTHQEFLDRVKDDLKVDVNYYTAYVEPVYLATCMSKDDFCKAFNKIGEHWIAEGDEVGELLDGIARYYKSTFNYEEKQDKRIEGFTSEIVRLENILIKNGQEELCKIKTADLIKRKVMMGMPLTDEQKQYISENLC